MLDNFESINEKKIILIRRCYYNNYIIYVKISNKQNKNIKLQ